MLVVINKCIWARYFPILKGALCFDVSQLWGSDKASDSEVTDLDHKISFFLFLTLGLVQKAVAECENGFFFGCSIKQDVIVLCSIWLWCKHLPPSGPLASPWARRWWKLHDLVVINFDSVPTCDGQTDRQMDTPPMAKSCRSIAEHDKKRTYCLSIICWFTGLPEANTEQGGVNSGRTWRERNDHIWQRASDLWLAQRVSNTRA